MRMPQKCLARAFTVDTLFAELISLGPRCLLQVNYDEHHSYPRSADESCLLDGDFPVTIRDLVPETSPQPDAVYARCMEDAFASLQRDAGNPAEPLLIMTRKGQQLRLVGQDSVDPRAWQPGDAVSVCLDLRRDPRSKEVHNLRRRESLPATAERRDR